MGGSSGAVRDKYMMKMLEKAFPKCVDGESIAVAAGTVMEATPASKKIAVVVPKEKPVADKKGLDKKIQVASIADDTAPAEETNFEKLMAGSDDVSAPDTKVLEAKIAETTRTGGEAGRKIAGQAAFRSEEGSEAPLKKRKWWRAWSELEHPDRAYPKKEEARLKRRRSAPRAILPHGKQAITVQVQKGSKTVYRARFSGFTQKTAKAACAQLSKKGLTCLAYSPQS